MARPLRQGGVDLSADPATAPDADPTTPANLAYCDEQCPEREGCLLRLSFGHVAKGHALATQAYPPALFPRAQALLEGLEPFLAHMDAERDACSRDKLATHEEEQEARNRLAPLVQETVRAELGGDLSEIKVMLEELARSGGHDAEGERLDDETAKRIVADYRTRYPEDAEAARHLFAETRVGLLQLARLTGWSKSNLSYWKNSPRKEKQGRNGSAHAPREDGPTKAPQG